jgi:acyl dehydratase
LSGYNFDVTTEGAPVRTRAARNEGRIDADATYAFARATNDDNPRYAQGDAVPPLFTATLILEAQFHSQVDGIGHAEVRNARGGVHGQHDVYFHRPVRAGMDVHWAASTYSAHQTKGGVLITQQIVVSDGVGPLVEHLWSSFSIGGTIDEEVGPVLADHTFPEDARARLVGSRHVAVERDQAFRYAGVSGDHAGHALDDEIAKAEGRQGKILQGMCTFGLASGAVVDLAADGDPDRLARLAVRFSAPAYPGKDLVVSLYDAGRTAEGGPVFAFEAVQDGIAVLRHGRVELRPE